MVKINTPKKMNVPGKPSKPPSVAKPKAPKQSEPTKPAVPATENKVDDNTAQAIRVERRQTSKGDPMWTCKTMTGESINIFDGDAPKLVRAGYNEILEMDLGDILNWNTHPIQIETVQKGQWVNVSHILTRSDDAEPDAPIAFSRNASKESVQAQIQTLLSFPDEDDVVIFDTETTGVDDIDEVMSIAVITLSSGKNLLPEENVFICPTNLNMADKASHVHGLTSDFMKDKPSFPEVYDVIAEALHGKVWIAYNTQFDQRMLDLMCGRYDLPPIVPVATIDAMELYGRFGLDWSENVDTNWRKAKLVDATDHFGIEVKDAHNAYGDILMTRLLMHAMAEAE